MSKCEIKIVFDDQKKIYLSKDEVSGHVWIDVFEDVRADGVKISLAWETHGKGDSDSGKGPTLDLGPFDWQARRSIKLPFKLRLPDRPLSYSGTHFNVQWCVLVEVDIPWAFDPKAERAFIMKPRGPANKFVARRILMIQAKAKESSHSLHWTGFIVLLALGIGFGKHFIEQILSGISLISYITPLVFMTIFFLVGIIFYFASAGSWFAQFRLGKVSIRLDDSMVATGDTVNVSVKFRPRSRVKLNSGQIALVCCEETVAGSGTNRRTYSHEQIVSSIQFTDAVQIGRDVPYRKHCRLEIPPDAHPSFELRHSTLRWTVEVALDVDGWADFHHDQPLVVR